MKKIFVRSPYFIQVDETDQLGSKIELYLYNEGESVPTLPTYTLSKKIASPTQIENIYNISNYAREYIKPIYPDTENDIAPESNNTWAYCLIKRYTELTVNTYTLLDEETFVCLNGYTDYAGGYNNYNDNSLVVLANPNIKILKYTNDTYINVFTDVNTSTQLLWSNDTDTFDVDIDQPFLLKLPIPSPGLWTLEFDEYIFYFNVEELCEAKYTPIECTFINRFGGWQFLTFFKANKTSIDVEYKKYDLTPQSVNYDPTVPITKTFNQQGKQKITCNTGWVDEDYFDLIQDLLLSQTILLDNKPVIVTSKSSDKKTYLKDKNINYTIDFEYAYGLINDII
jgi:hypothetical protein